MGAIVVVVVGELVQDRTQVALAEGNQMVEALAADGPHPAFRDRVGDRFQLRAMGTVRDDFASSIPTTLWSAKGMGYGRRFSARESAGMSLDRGRRWIGPQLSKSSETSSCPEINGVS